MSSLRYAVMQCDETWRVVGGERRIGHYADRATAVAAGARLVREAMKMGHQVEFLIQDPAGELIAFDPKPEGSAG